MMLIVHHQGEWRTEVMCHTAHKAYRRDSAQAAIPSFHSWIQLADVVQAHIHIINIRCEIVLIEEIEASQHHAIECHHLG